MAKKKERFLQNLSTEHIRCHEQFSYWNEFICERILHVDLNRRNKGPFAGSLKTYQLGSFSFNRVKSEEHVAELTQKGVNRYVSPVYKFHIQTSSYVKVKQHGYENILKPGDAILIDCVYPFKLDFPETFDCFSVKIPREKLRPLLEDPKVASTSKIPGISSLGKAIQHYIQFLIRISKTSQTEEQIQLYLDSLLSLIATAVSASATEWDTSPLASNHRKIEQIKSYVLDNLGDPELSPAKVAEHFSISVSYLHKLFAKEKKTFGYFVREHRLDLAAQYLLQQGEDTMTITELAYRLGFNDLSHFWRSFRERYGMTPRKYRFQTSPAWRSIQSDPTRHILNVG